MELAAREIWTVVHGMILGGLFLMAFTGGLVCLVDLRVERQGGDGGVASLRRLQAWTWGMALLAWLTVIVGSYVVYPWYRATPPRGIAVAGLGPYPKYLLLSNPHTADWHEFGMEWKEHVAWLTPILSTAVAVLVTKDPRRIATDPLARRAVLALYTCAFVSASIAGFMGAMIDKAAPMR